MTGLASGLVETMREIGGAVGAAAVSTVLASHAGGLASAGSPATRQVEAASAFHSAFWVMFVAAALGAGTAAIAFPRHATRHEPHPDPSQVSIVPEPAEN